VDWRWPRRHPAWRWRSWKAAEVESARLLANDARQALLAAGLSDADIDRLADDFMAEDRGEATKPFIDWAIRVHRAAAPVRSA
jgi:hypothetical protein